MVKNFIIEYVWGPDELGRIKPEMQWDTAEDHAARSCVAKDGTLSSVSEGGAIHSNP
jgi:hypothetical protein